MDNLEIKHSSELIEYRDALNFMENRLQQIILGNAKELLWLLEHSPVYTAGTSADSSELLNSEVFPVYSTGRGGKYTYHGPGQRVAYIMMDLKKRYKQPDLKKYIYDLEQLIINSLDNFGIKGERRTGRVGIWITGDKNKEEKIAAIGVRVRKWVTYHGIAINLKPNLSHFQNIIPCGIADYGVTSFEKLGVKISMDTLDMVLVNEFKKSFSTKTYINNIEG